MQNRRLFMRRTAEQNKKRDMIITIIKAVLCCLGVIFLCLVIFSAAASRINLSDGVLSVMSGTALSPGCFTAAYIAAAQRRKHGLLTGLLWGGAVFLAVMLLGAIFVRSFSAGGIFAKLLMILACSGIGGILGTNSKKRY